MFVSIKTGAVGGEGSRKCIISDFFQNYSVQITSDMLTLTEDLDPVSDPAIITLVSDCYGDRIAEINLCLRKGFKKYSFHFFFFGGGEKWFKSIKYFVIFIFGHKKSLMENLDQPTQP